MSTITMLLRQLSDMGHKTTIIAQLKEDEYGEMDIQFMCNDAPNRFGINIRVSDTNDETDVLFEKALDALVRHAKELALKGGK